eukprot:TRINITY_DN22844_c0_g1_i1.p1 TRINITY_DN22844_c0_g1~~TRINITY_DN22844_c0_g1_i1.p1  ORF type:complete len:232 (-),score=61.96 TRINITY_DN22844_c0_g1_i1:132-827(-)
MPLRSAAVSALACLPVAAAMSAAGPRMSELFESFAELDAAPGVQGVPWATLEKRCRPGAGPGQTQGGWISDGTPLKEVLREDWATVKRLGTTHMELAAHMDAIWAASRTCDFTSAKSEIDYDVRSLPQNTLKSDGPVHLRVSCMHTRGIQDDLIKADGFFSGWNVDWKVQAADETFRIGGRNSTAGILQYVKQFGFYEGGKDNEYRLDPAKLVKALTGGRHRAAGTEFNIV